MVSHCARAWAEAAATDDPRARALSLELVAAFREALEPYSELLALLEEVEQGGPFWDRQTNALAKLAIDADKAADDEEGTG